MIITKQRIVLPKSLAINVEVVDVFKLLGVTIDHNLFFNKYFDFQSLLSIVSCTLLKSFFTINEHQVQFFKTFIQPHFDYCSSLSGILQQKRYLIRSNVSLTFVYFF